MQMTNNIYHHGGEKCRQVVPSCVLSVKCSVATIVHDPLRELFGLGFTMLSLGCKGSFLQHSLCIMFCALSMCNPAGGKAEELIALTVGNPLCYPMAVLQENLAPEKVRLPKSWLPYL